MKTRYIILAICLLFSASIVFAQWEQSNGPFGGQVTCLALSGTQVFAGTDRGLFRSTDNGLSWKAANTGLPQDLIDNLPRLPRITALAANDTSIFAACGGSVYASVNGGESWEPAGNGLPENVIITSFGFSGNYLFAGSESGLFRTVNGGADWQIVTGPNGTFGVKAIAISPSIIYAVYNNTIFRSTDDGTSWSDLPAVLPYWANAMATLDTELFVGTDFGAYRSIDSGATWVAVNAGLDNSNPGTFAVADSTLFAAGSWTRGVFRLTASHDSWVHETDGFTNAHTSALVLSGSTIFAGTFTEGAFRSTDGGTHWEHSTYGLRPLDTRAIAVSASNLIAATENGIFLSSDGGTTWTLTPGPQNATLVAAEDSIVFASSEMFGDQLQISTNRGISWNVLELGWPYWASGLAMLATGSELYIASAPSGEWEGGVFKYSIDNLLGTSMHTPIFHMETQQVGSPYLVHALSVLDSTLYVGASNGIFLATHDHKWVFVGLGGVYVHALLVPDSNLFAGTRSGFFRSTDRGGTWTGSNAGLGDSIITTLVAYGPDLFAGTSRAGVFHSSDRGASWADVSAGLPSLNVVSLTVYDSYLVAGTEGGAVSRRPLNQLVDVKIPSPPQLVYPPDRATFVGESFSFHWTPVANATFYHLQASKDSLFQTRVFLDDSTLTDTTRSSLPTDSTIQGYLEGRSFWRVRARSTVGWSAWSAPWSFVVSTTAVNGSPKGPLQFSLEQNHPNPFNPFTIIQYTVGGSGVDQPASGLAGGRGGREAGAGAWGPGAEVVTLKVYDLLGREVSTLVNERKAPGNYEVSFDARELASGIYLYRMTTGAFVQTRKMVVLK